MARSLRIEYPNAWYHVMNRGIARQNIFVNENHYSLFLELLEEAHLMFKIEVHAYCLMSNHYHLFIRTPHANLSKIMRHINGNFAQRFNKSEKRDGSVFKGRFKAILVDSESYFLQVSRYVHLNPVEANIVKNPADYKWSSYKYFLSKKDKPKWLYIDETLFRFKNSSELYRGFVLEGVDSETRNFFNDKHHPIFGSNTFIESFKDHAKMLPHEEIPDITRIIRGALPSVNEVIDEVIKSFYANTEKDWKEDINWRKNFTRNVAVYISSKITGESHRLISKKFEGISRSGVSKICFRMHSNVQNNLKLKEEINHIIEVLLRK